MIRGVVEFLYTTCDRLSLIGLPETLSRYFFELALIQNEGAWPKKLRASEIDYLILCPEYYNLQDLTPNPDKHVPEIEAIALEVITYIGLIISLLCLAVFVISYFCSK